LENKIINLVNTRKDKTPINPPLKEKIDNREISVVLKEDYDIKVGDLFLDVERDPELFRIKKIKKGIFKGNIYTEYIETEHKYIRGFISSSVEVDSEEEKSEYYNKWKRYGDHSISDILSKLEHNRWARLDFEEQFFELLNKYEENVKDFSVFKEKTSQEVSSETSLMRMDENYLKSMEKLYNEKQNKMLLLQGIARYKMLQLQVIQKQFLTVVEKIQKVIGKIELYLGVNEEVIQIQDGVVADTNEPIHLFQKILYMDEEVGVVEDGGLDWKNIDDFDNWLLKGHLDLIAPVKKCIVILRVRRNDKCYYKNVWDNKDANQENRYTYFLIRNGDKVYRIYASIIIEPRLFPKKTEIDDINSDEHVWRKEEAVKEKIDKYHNHFLPIQGILDRSNLLWPLPHKIDIFDENTWGKILILVRDDELTLPDGHLPYSEWKEELNSHNEIGSRIVYSGLSWRSEPKSRIRGASQFTQSPSRGIYNVKRFEDETKHRLVIWYNPEDTVYNWGNYWSGNYSHVRKKSVAFILYRNEECVMNYDHLKVEDIDFYINCRQEREHYLDLIPLLKTLKKEKLKEKVEEDAFKELIFIQLKLEGNKQNREIVDKAIEWWKFKVIEKRPLIREDAKAIRMIMSKIRKISV
jgi:hypothetical protein